MAQANMDIVSFGDDLTAVCNLPEVKRGYLLSKFLRSWSRRQSDKAGVITKKTDFVITVPLIPYRHAARWRQ
jgi:hypothetical protein